MAKRQRIWISVNTTPQCPFNNFQDDFRITSAYEYDKELQICIAKDESYINQYAWTDIATGCSFGRRFKTIKEAKSVRDNDPQTFESWCRKIIHLRRMSSTYHELKSRKTIYLNHWRVQDEF